MITYLKNPIYKQEDQFNVRNYTYYILKAYALSFIFIALSGFILLTIDPIITNIFNVPSIFQSFKKSNDSLSSLYGKYTFLIVAIVVPFIEESIFRLPLNLKKWSIGISLSIMVFRFSGKGFFCVSFTEPYTYFRICLAMLVFLSVKFLLKESFLNLIQGKYFKIYFYAITAVFSLVHISNASDIHLKILPVYILYVLPQFVMGLSLGTVRMEKGFFAACILHFLFNSVYFLFSK